MRQTITNFVVEVNAWMLNCFGNVIAFDEVERNHRFVEESLELAQSCGCTRNEARQLVDYVYSRPVGDMVQEAGGVAVTLAALCTAQGINLELAATTELLRCVRKSDAIRAKNLAKPRFSPLTQRSDSDRASQLEILRRSIDRGLSLAQMHSTSEADAEQRFNFIDIFQHLKDELQRLN